MTAGRLLYLEAVLLWAAAATRQYERLTAATLADRAMLDEANQLPEGDPVPTGFLEAQREHQAEVHFFLNAVYQLSKAVDQQPYGPPLPRFPEPLRTDVKHLRDIHEHWEQARSGGRHLRDMFSWARKSGAEYRRRHPGRWPHSYTTDAGGELVQLGTVIELPVLLRVIAEIRTAAETAA